MDKEEGGETMNRKECIALVLAGGQGSRLGILTTKLAKPAVPFGGKYRIIDFTLSNCSNSGIDTVGVLTQYEPLILNSYIGIGSHWGLDRSKGGVTVLSPYVSKKGGNWYQGTADAIYQNIDYIDLYNPMYVLILSGDHIYKMDYSKMIDYHKAREADLTIAAMAVELEEAKRFGIIVANPEGEIIGFQEKPQKPKSKLASMGVYVFKWDRLRKYLIEDSLDSSSSHDFGKDIIPKMLKDKQRLWAYPFSGYWKDVGTVESLWEANMDLLDPKPRLNLNERDWKIYSVNPVKPPHYIAKTGVIRESLITEGCIIEGEIERSVIFPGVVIQKGVKIINSIIMSGVTILEGSIIEKSIIGEETYVGKNCVIGSLSGEITVIAENVILKDKTIIKSGTTVEGNDKGGRL